jgi:hypothetical protein
MTVGIYAIVNKKTGDRYVGQSLNIEKRWVQHKNDLRSRSASSAAFQEAWDLYGQDTFEFVILQECEKHELDQYEAHHMMEGSSLNTQTGYVVPLAIEEELDVDPNGWLVDDIDVPNEFQIKSKEELVLAFEELARLQRRAEILSDAIDTFIGEGPLADDRLISVFWDKIALMPSDMIGASLEIIRSLRE